MKIVHRGKSVVIWPGIWVAPVVSLGPSGLKSDSLLRILQSLLVEAQRQVRGRPVSEQRVVRLGARYGLAVHLDRLYTTNAVFS